MKRIALIHSGKSYLPECQAYFDFLSKNNFEIEILQNRSNIIEYSPDLIWMFMGIDCNRREIPVIHEYNSLSTGSCPRIKNRIKRAINAKPDFRFFLNEKVKVELGFTGQVASQIRDMGIAKEFFSGAVKKEYDFVYCGSINKQRSLTKLFDKFMGREETLLVIGEPEREMLEKYSDNKNMIFTGSVSYKEVPELMGKATYGINYIPDIYPYNIQTSTKLLEYAAMGLSIVTNDYEWVRTFEQKRKMKFYKFKNIDEFSFDDILKFDYKTNDVNDLEWDCLFERIALLDIIKKLI